MVLALAAIAAAVAAARKSKGGVFSVLLVGLLAAGVVAGLPAQPASAAASRDTATCSIDITIDGTKYTFPGYVIYTYETPTPVVPDPEPEPTPTPVPDNPEPEPEPDVTGVIVEKIWEDENDEAEVRPDSITLNLMKGDEQFVQAVTLTANDASPEDANTWQKELEDLPVYDAEDELIDYYLDEPVVPDGYEIVPTSGTPRSANSTDPLTVVIVNGYFPEPETVSFSVQKVWNDVDDQDGLRPSSVIFNILADGDEIDSGFLSQEDDWAITVEGLPKYKDGKEIIYAIEEVQDQYATNEDDENPYTCSITGNMTDGFVVTNTHIPETTSITVSKVWDDEDDQDGIRPDTVTVNLLADKEVADSVILTASNGWKHTFENLPVYNSGDRIYYDIKEVDFDLSESDYGISGYFPIVDISENGDFVITNRHYPETTFIVGTKTWEDNDNANNTRPESITVNLLANGQKIQSTTASEEDYWVFDFTDLPKYENGQEITYTITEEPVEGYTTTIDGFEIINTFIPEPEPETIDVTVTKLWDDADNQDGIRPESITINLLADGDQVDSAVVTEDDNWECEFVGLLKYNDSEEEIVYTIEEQTDSVITGVDASGTYQSAITGNAEDGFTVTNTHTPETTSITLIKTWRADWWESEPAPPGGEGKPAWAPSSNDIDAFKSALVLKADGVEYTSVAPAFGELSPSEEKTETSSGGEPSAYTICTQEVTWSDLPKIKDGKDIVYTVEEKVMSNYNNGYPGAVSGDAATRFAVTNVASDDIPDDTGHDNT